MVWGRLGYMQPRLRFGYKREKGTYEVHTFETDLEPLSPLSLSPTPSISGVVSTPKEQFLHTLCTLTGYRIPQVGLKHFTVLICKLKAKPRGYKTIPQSAPRFRTLLGFIKPYIVLTSSLNLGVGTFGGRILAPSQASMWLNDFRFGRAWGLVHGACCSGLRGLVVYLRGA